MRTVHLHPLLTTVLLAVIGLGFVAPAQPQALCDTFLLGANWVDSSEYHTVKTDLHFNYLFNGLTTGRLQAAADEGLYMAGKDIAGSDPYWGISGLGDTEAGRYWGRADSLNQWHGIPMWLHELNSLTGSDVQESDIPGLLGQNTWVRKVLVGSCAAGLMLDSLHGGFCPFVWSKEGDHNYYLRIYGRKLSEPQGNDSLILTVKADWYDYSQPYANYRQLALWDTVTVNDTIGEFYANDLTANWSLSARKWLWVENPDDGDYWRGSLSIYWTGNCDLEIYYVTISDSVGDVTVFNPSHPSDAFIEADKYYSQLCK